MGPNGQTNTVVTPITPPSSTTAGMQSNDLTAAINSLGAGALSNPYIQSAATAVNQSNAALGGLPTFVQNQAMGLGQEAQLPQINSGIQNLNKLYQMFVADQGLAQQYTNPATQVGNSANPQVYNATAPTYGTVGVPQMPMMTPQNVNQSFQGFTDPGLAAATQYEQGQGIAGTLQNIANLYNYNLGTAQSQLNQNVYDYQSQISGLNNVASLLYNLGLENIMYGGVGGSQAVYWQTHPQQLSAAIQSDIKKGTTLTDLLSKWNNIADPTMMFNLYNSNSPYGPANEDPSTLSSWGIKIPTSYQKNYDQTLAAGNGVASVMSLLDQYNSLNIADKLNPFSSTAGAYDTARLTAVDQLAKAFGISRSNPAIQRILGALPGRTSLVANVGSAQLQAAINQLLVSQGMLLVKQKSTGDVGVIRNTEFNPKLYVEVK